VLVTRAPDFELRPDGTAVVRLHAVDTRSDFQALAWANTLHDGIAALASHHPRAWVVDLRDHDGDSPWPAFAALSTLLDGPAVGAFASRQGRQEWIADRGVSRIAGGPALVDLQSPPEPTFRGPVAVLIGPNTRNVGEDVTVALRGRAHTRFFGAPTAGFPILGVQVHTLSDGTTLGVLETRDVDRTGVVHRLPVEPDTVLPADVSLAAMPQQVVDWIDEERVRAAGSQ
jgi:C-terminal processing protease CtpA/Prc